jgi:hypothetical protein
MASVTHRVTTPSTSNASSYASGSFTPAVDDLLVVVVTASGTVASGSLSSSAGITFTKVLTALKNASADTLYLFVANSRVASATSQTVTFDCTGDSATGAIVTVASVSGLAKVGSSVVLKSGKQDNGAAAATPTVALGSAALTGNALIGFVGNGSSPATLTPPSSWAELFDSTGYSTPTTGHEVASINSGFTGSTVTWGSTSGTAFAAIVAELSTANDAAASGSMDFSGSSAGAVAISAQASSSLALTGSAVATNPIAATSLGSLGLTGASGGAVASSGIAGTASGSLALSGASVGSIAVAGSATGAFGLSGSAAGQAAVSGAGSGLLDMTGAGTGTVAIGGQAVGSLSLAGSANGAVADAGASSGGLSLIGSAAGTVALQGATTGSLTFSGSADGAVGNVPISGDAAGDLALTGSAEAMAEITGGATLSFSLGGQALATVEINGGASGELGLSGSGSASSFASINGTASGVAGLDGSATGWVISANDQFPLRGRRCARPLAGRSRTYPLRRAA